MKESVSLFKISLVGWIKRSESTIHAIIVGGYGAKTSAFIHPTHTDPINGYKKSGMHPFKRRTDFNSARK
ncbi:MAG: hypothetical protein FJ264_12445 [Planctomycetes bacterium]|nr:hypothetical protein [Planctomycetota bacterium]